MPKPVHTPRMSAVWSSLRQAMVSWAFLAALAGTALVLLLSCIEGIVSGLRLTGYAYFGYHTELIIQALSGEAMTLALPILAALPFTAGTVDDVKSGYIKAYLSRTSRARYLAGRVTACALSGGTALLAGTAAAWGIVALIFLPMEAPPNIVDAAGNAIRYVSPIWSKLLLCFASGCFWASVGMLAANLSMSRYMAYAAPFVVYYILIILCERYFDSLYVLYPKEWLSPSALWQYGTAGALLWIAELTVIAAVCAALAGARRISDAK